MGFFVSTWNHLKVMDELNYLKEKPRELEIAYTALEENKVKIHIYEKGRFYTFCSIFGSALTVASTVSISALNIFDGPSFDVFSVFYSGCLLLDGFMLYQYCKELRSLNQVEKG